MIKLKVKRTADKSKKQSLKNIKSKLAKSSITDESGTTLPLTSKKQIGLSCSNNLIIKTFWKIKSKYNLSEEKGSSVRDVIHRVNRNLQSP